MLVKHESIEAPAGSRNAPILTRRDNRCGRRSIEINAGGKAKRALDVLVCLAALPVMLPLFAIIALGVKTSSPGPVFYRGRRTGLGDRVFRIFKFRTMSVDAEKTGGGVTALNDFRVFPFGNLLRRYKLDELPQIFNVLAGDMSLVGPRPELPRYTDQFQGDELLILSVRPGITDYSSIRFSSLDEIVGSKDVDRVFEEEVLAEKNRLRVKYVKERTFFGDIALIFRTLACVLKKAF